MTARTDAALVTAARAGDRDAFAALVQRHRPALLRVCRRALGQRGGAADAAGEAVVHALAGLPALRDDAAFGPWLCGIGANVARRARRMPPPLPLEGLPEPAVPGPEDRHDALWVRAAVAALPPGQRDAVALFYLADLPHAEVAERLGISVGAVKTRLHKARASLQGRLADLRKEPPTMPSVTMRVADVIAADPLHIVLLEEAGGGRRLPIWIPPAEATWLAKRLREEDHPRPDTYRFIADLLAAARTTLREARIVRLAETIFYAEAVLEDGSAIDARPSDAINLALVAGAPIRVEEAVLADAAEHEAETAAMLDAALRDRTTGPGRGA